MAVSAFMARQYAQPSGIFGRLVTAPLLNRANRQSNALVFQMLDLTHAKTVLEIGFGGGQLLSMIALAETKAEVHGLELSDAMLERARRGFAAEKSGKTVRLGYGQADSITYPDNYFDRVCSVNTLYFWKELDAAIAELSRVIQAGGLLVLGFGSDTSLRASGYEAQGFILYSVDQVLDGLASGGFVLTEHRQIEREARGNFHVLKCTRHSGEHEI